MPPNDVDTVEAIFNPLEKRNWITTIAWDGLFSEENEVYKIYRHGEYFSSTNDPYAQLIATVAEKQQIPIMMVHSYSTTTYHTTHLVTSSTVL